MKFRVSKNLDYVMGHLRHGHKEIILECESKAELVKMLEDEYFADDMEIVIDDFRIDDYEESIEPYEVEEIK